MKALAPILFFIVFCVFQSLAQQGDRSDPAGEKQLERVPVEKIPPAPPLSPEKALKSFRLQPGFRIELVANEPLVHDPVTIAFDPAGRIWVVEMSGYMPNPDGKGEDEPVGKVAVLEDTDGDGKMDKRTEFLTGLVLPNSISLVRDGVLIAAPPYLWFCRDTNGDLKCDEKIEIARDYGVAGNPQHTANGLLWARDNWIYSSVWMFRLRSRPGGLFERETTISRGQYGISQDDEGRLIYNSNVDQFRIDLVPSRYLKRNPNYPAAAGLNVDVIQNQATFPIRVTPGVNRGYQKGLLRADGTLAAFTACCSPLVYRGSQFPDEFYGNFFTCEPSANLIKRNLLWEETGVLKGAQAYTNAEFLASTDERFRPTWVSNGPDGALYVVDFYRGILEHRLFLTSYLRRQIESRGLDKPLGLGRIYRIVHEGKRLKKSPLLATADLETLVQMLAHPDGWIRDTAQRLLVERSDPAGLPALKRLAAGREHASTRLHALWTLDGMTQLDEQTVFAALADPNPKVRATAIRLAERFLKSEEANEFIIRLSGMASSDSTSDVLLQLALTLGETGDSRAEAAMAVIARHASSNLYIRDALLTGLYGREMNFLEKLIADGAWKQPEPGSDLFLSGLASCIFTTKRSDVINRLFELATAAEPWQRTALLDGIISTAPMGKNALPKLARFGNEPSGWRKLKSSNESQISQRCEKISKLITWPGQAGYVPPPIVRTLNAEEQNRFDLGKKLYLGICAGCHQPGGMGMEGLAPPLVDSEWVRGSEQRLARIAFHGLRGPITVKGRTWNLDMPGLGSALDDEQMAAVLTYLRREWEHPADPVSPVLIKELRAASSARAESWSETELMKIP